MIFKFKFKIEFEFNLVLYLIRTFHVGLFFWHCHMVFLIWCCVCHFYVSGDNLKTWHVTWFHLLVVHCWHIINWKLIWSQIIDHDQSDGLYSILYFTLYSKNYNFSLTHTHTHTHIYEQDLSIVLMCCSLGSFLKILSCGFFLIDRSVFLS